MMKRWTVERVQRLLDFGCGDRFGATSAMVRMQTEGVAALCEILRKRHVAYLADEVGLGKTMQALGVAACMSQGREDARVLVISPRKIVQNGWEAEHARFTNYVLRAKSDAMPLQFHESLREWLACGPETPGIQLLRHSSFTRPVFNSKGSWSDALRASRLPDALREFIERQQPASTGDPGRDYNLALARGVNRWLKRREIQFDLIVVDEAQCLRNLRQQQTNSVLQALLDGVGENWLFLSATPAHSGLHNIRTVLNEYAGRGTLVDQECLKDPSRMKMVLKDYMIRRPRVFRVGDCTVHKSEYRKDDDQSLKLHCQDPLSLLSIALVQKHLARALGSDGGRFRSGFIASFESLEDSLRDRGVRPPAVPALDAEAEEEQIEASDFYMEHHHTADESRAPDEGYVSAISRDFQGRFGIGLPHPKLDGVEADLARQAFGDPDVGDPGGTKSVVFCRRLSSVSVLRERLIRRYLAGVEARCLRVWGKTLDWDAMMENAGYEAAAAGDAGPPPSTGEVEWDAVNRVREAQAEPNWLYKFRMTFADGRNALALELNWFERLCRETGVSVAKAAAKVPEHLWAESQAMATRQRRRYRAEQARYLVWLALKECGREIFEMSERQVARWKSLLEPLLGIPTQWEPLRQRVAVEPELLTFRSIWTLVEEGQDAAMHLPGANRDCTDEDILWRKIVATVIGQYLRLTDAAIDMFFAENKDEKDSLQRNFTRWLLGTDGDAVRLRQIWKDWIAHRVLIFSSAVGEKAAMTSATLATKDSFDFLNNLDPVVGITGSAGGHKRAMQQFNTPGMPFVMIGTDTIREGVNLHLFCDRVMHYGMPWTPGDMEQRIGRVDRFFGRIERRLQARAKGEDVALHILYPFLQDTVEQQQIRTVMHRLRESESVIDDAFGSTRKDLQSKQIELDAVLVPELKKSRNSGSDESFFGVTRHLRPSN